MDCLLNAGVTGLGGSGLITTDPPEQCAGELTMFVLAGLEEGSGQYIGVGGE